MRNNFFGLLGFLMTSFPTFAQLPYGDREMRARPFSQLKPEEQEEIRQKEAKQKEAAENKTRQQGRSDSVDIVLADLGILGVGKFATITVGAVVNSSKNRSAIAAENKILEAAKTGLNNKDYTNYLYDYSATGNGIQFANDLEALKKKAFAFGNQLKNNDLFSIVEEGSSENRRLEDFRNALLKTDTATLQKEAQALKKEIKDFVEKYPREVDKINYMKAYLRGGDYDFEKLENLKNAISTGKNTIDKFDFESARDNLRKASDNVDEVIRANNRFIQVTANMKIANEIRNLKKAATPSRSLKALKAAGWFGAGFIAVDIYGNILNISSDTPKPNVVIGQLGAEILAKTPEAIFEAAKKVIEQKPAADRGTVDELDPTAPKKGH